MDFRFFLDEPFWLLVALTLAYSVYRVIRYRGLRAGMFSSLIRSSVGTVKAGGVKGFSHQLKVYELRDSQQERRVGVELRSTTPLSYEMEGIALSGDAARELARLLRAAAQSAQ